MSLPDFTKLSVDEIRTALVSKFGLNVDDVGQIKGKTALVETYTKMAAVLGDGDDEELPEVDLETVDVSLDDTDAACALKIVDGTGEAVEVIPDHNSPGWTDFILSKLTDNEMFNGMPTVDGLRRMVETYVGRIIEGKTHVVDAPRKENDNRATIVHTVVIIEHDTDERLEFDGAADAYSGNTEKYDNFPVSIAETRAEGRAFRRALRIHTIAAEEAEKTYTGPTYVTPATEFSREGKLSDAQIRTLDILCQLPIGDSSRGMNINIKKVAESILDKPISSVKDISSEEGAVLVQKVSTFQGSGVPEEFVGYESNWRS